MNHTEIKLECLKLVCQAIKFPHYIPCEDEEKEKERVKNYFSNVFATAKTFYKWLYVDDSKEIKIV